MFKNMFNATSWVAGGRTWYTGVPPTSCSYRLTI